MLIAFALFALPHAFAQTAVPALRHTSFERFAHTFTVNATEGELTSSSSTGPVFEPVFGPVPTAPDALTGQAVASHGTARAGRKVAPAGPYDKYILPGQQAPKLTSTDKVVIGFRDSLTPLTAIGWVGSATFEQIIDGPPNYGETGKGYVQRIGAAAARGASQNIFSAALFAPIFHQDPRFYKLGDGHHAATRVLYAASRTLITRGDNGKQQLNLSLLLGHLGGTSLTQAYYPPLNRGLRDLSHTYIESLLAASISFTFSEYLADALNFLHLQSVKFL
jgi:hypothetical protein